ncbi:hypothetical protein BsWGS_03574 [Bradybaena similaris]
MTNDLLFEKEQDLPRETREIMDKDNNNDTSTHNSGIITTLSTTDDTTWSLSSTTQSNTTLGNTTQPNLTTSVPIIAGNRDAATAVGVVAILAVVAFLIILLLCYLRRKGKLNKLPCCRPMTRARRSSSSSRHVLEEHEVMENDARPKPEGQSDDTFTIEDLENAADPQEGNEEYYYDEVFGQSQFEDEATNTAVRELYSETQEMSEEEILDLDFETLGIRITDYGPDIDRKNTV